MSESDYENDGFEKEPVTPSDQMEEVPMYDYNADVVKAEKGVSKVSNPPLNPEQNDPVQAQRSKKIPSNAQTNPTVSSAKYSSFDEEEQEKLTKQFWSSTAAEAPKRPVEGKQTEFVRPKAPEIKPKSMSENYSEPQSSEAESRKQKATNSKEQAQKKERKEKAPTKPGRQIKRPLIEPMENFSQEEYLKQFQAETKTQQQPPPVKQEHNPQKQTGPVKQEIKPLVLPEKSQPKQQRPSSKQETPKTKPKEDTMQFPVVKNRPSDERQSAKPMRTTNSFTLKQKNDEQKTQIFAITEKKQPQKMSQRILPTHLKPEETLTSLHASVKKQNDPNLTKTYNIYMHEFRPKRSIDLGQHKKNGLVSYPLSAHFTESNIPTGNLGGHVQKLQKMQMQNAAYSSTGVFLEPTQNNFMENSPNKIHRNHFASSSFSQQQKKGALSQDRDHLEEIHFRSKLFGSSKNSPERNQSKKARQMASTALSAHYEMLSIDPHNQMAANEVITSLEEKVATLENAISKKDQILQNMISLYDEQNQEDMYQEEEATRFQPAPLNPRQQRVIYQLKAELDALTKSAVNREREIAKLKSNIRVKRYQECDEQRLQYMNELIRMHKFMETKGVKEFKGIRITKAVGVSPKNAKSQLLKRDRSEELHETNHKNRLLQERLEQCRVAVLDLKAQNADNGAKVEKLLSKKSELEDELEKIKLDQKTSVSTKVDNLKAEVESLQEKIKSQVAENKKLAAKGEEFAKLKTLYDELEKNYKQKVDLIAIKEKQVTRMTEEKTALNAQYTQLRVDTNKTTQDQQDKITELQEKLTSEERNLSMTANRQSHLLTEKQDLMDQVAALQKEVDSLKKKLVQNDNPPETIGTIEARQTSENQSIDANTMKTIGQQTLEITQRDEQITELKLKSQETQHTLDDLQEQLRKLKTEVVSRNQRTEQDTFTDQKSQALAKFEGREKELLAKIEELEAALEQVTQQLQKVETPVVETRPISSKQSSRTDREKREQALKQNNEQLRKQLTDVDEVNSKTIMDLKAQNKSLKDSIEKRNQEISNEKLQETQEFVKTVLGYYLSQLGLDDKTSFDAFLEDEDDSVWNAQLFIPSYILKSMPSSPKERSTFIFNILGDSLKNTEAPGNADDVTLSFKKLQEKLTQEQKGLESIYKSKKQLAAQDLKNVLWKVLADPQCAKVITDQCCLNSILGKNRVSKDTFMANYFIFTALTQAEKDSYLEKNKKIKEQETKLAQLEKEKQEQANLAEKKEQIQKEALKKQEEANNKASAQSKIETLALETASQVDKEGFDAETFEFIKQNEFFSVLAKEANASIFNIRSRIPVFNVTSKELGQKDGNSSEVEVIEEEAFVTNILGPLNLKKFIEIRIPASPQEFKIALQRISASAMYTSPTEKKSVIILPLLLSALRVQGYEHGGVSLDSVRRQLTKRTLSDNKNQANSEQALMGEKDFDYRSLEPRSIRVLNRLSMLVATYQTRYQAKAAEGVSVSFELIVGAIFKGKIMSIKVQDKEDDRVWTISEEDFFGVLNTMKVRKSKEAMTNLSQFLQLKQEIKLKTNSEKTHLYISFHKLVNVVEQCLQSNYLKLLGFKKTKMGGPVVQKDMTEPSARTLGQNLEAPNDSNMEYYDEEDDGQHEEGPGSEMVTRPKPTNMNSSLHTFGKINSDRKLVEQEKAAEDEYYDEEQ